MNILLYLRWVENVVVMLESNLKFVDFIEVDVISFHNQSVQAAMRKRLGLLTYYRICWTVLEFALGNTDFVVLLLLPLSSLLLSLFLFWNSPSLRFEIILFVSGDFLFNDFISNRHLDKDLSTIFVEACWQFSREMEQLVTTKRSLEEMGVESEELMD